MATSPRKKELRAQRKASGLCIHCGKAAIEGLTRCRRCSDRDKENRKRYAERDAKNGVCCSLGCRSRTDGKQRYCVACTIASTGKTSRRRAARKGKGLCTQCGQKPAVRGLIRCNECHARMLAAIQAIAARRRAKGLCPRCGQSLKTGHKICPACVERYQEAQSARKRLILMAYGGPRCVGCSETELMVLQVDHIHGGGSRHAREIGYGALYNWLIKNNFPPGFRCLCASCNCRAARGGRLPLEEGYQPCLDCFFIRSRTHAVRKKQVLEAYGGPVCVGCDETDVLTLQIDHINGGGYKHAQEIGGRGAMYAWLIKNNCPPGFRVLCASCNIRSLRGIPFPRDRQ